MSDIDDIIASLRAVGAKDLGAQVAQEAEEPLREALAKPLQEGSAPDGAPWEARKEGGRAYAGAASKLKVKSFGDLIRASVSGGEAFGHFGARGMPVRRMLPDAGGSIPQTVLEALTKAARKVLERVTK